MKKLLLSSILAAATVSSITPFAFAADTTLSVTGVSANSMLKAYKVGTIDVVSTTGDANDTLGAFDVATDAGNKAAVNAAFAEGAGQDTDNPVAWIMKNWTSTEASNGHAGDLQTWAAKLAKADSLSGGVDLAVSGSTASATLPEGVYVVVDKSTTSDQLLPMFVTTSLKDGSVTKFGSVTLGTAAGKHNEVSAPTEKIKDDVAGTYGNSTSVGTGHTADLQITQPVPYMTSFDKFPITITKTLPEGVTYNSTTPATVKVDGTDVTGATVEYDQATRKLTVKIPDASTLTPGKDIMVDYKVDVAPGTELSSTPLGELKVEYPRELTATSETTNLSEKDGTPATATTHTVTIKSVNKDSQEVANATYTLSRTNGDTYEIKVDANGNVSTSSDGVTATLTAGSLEIKGLDSGEYTLTETDAPEGYSDLALPTVNFTIGEDGTVTEGTGDDNNLVEVDGTTIKVTHIRSLTELPNTGLYGMALMALVGAIVAVASFGVSLFGKKKSA